MKLRIIAALLFTLIINHSSLAVDVDNSTAPTLRVFVMLDQPSLAEKVVAYQAKHRIAPSKSWQQSQSVQITHHQAQIRQQIEPLLVKEHSALRIVLNGFRATVRQADLKTLRDTKGIRAVSRIRQHDLDNIDSVDWIEAPKIWQNFGDGEGMTIAIIDTGIDYLHKNFGGDGDTDSYAQNDPNVLEPNTFPTAKVIGGWDFAGPTYNSRLDEEPQPDPDPLDIHGHGSHVAGTAGGLGIFDVPGPDEPDLIGPGVAKGSSLLALKVFSDIGGSTDLTVDAIERALDPNQDGAMDDRVDVINMSLGARFGLPTDPSAIAAGNAVKAGVIVVASAGNNGELPYVVGSPGVSEPIITVAASISGGRRQIALSAQINNQPNLFAALEGSGQVRLSQTIQSGALTLARSMTEGSSDESHYACEPLLPLQEYKDSFVLVQRGECNFPIKYANVQRVGGAGIVVFNSSDLVLDLFVMGGLGETATIPGVMITQAAGQILLEQIESNEYPLIASLSTKLTVPVPTTQDDTLANFTSQGPAGGRGFKPDLAAPGRFIFSTAAGTGNQGVERRGTSMSAPHIAGMAALLKQQYPHYSPATIKSMLMNSSTPSNIDGPDSITPYPISRQGAGVVRGGHAMLSKAITQPAGVSFGYLNPVNSGMHQRQVLLTNLTNQTLFYSVDHHSAVTQPGVEVDCPENIELAPHSQIQISVSLTIDAPQLSDDDGKFSFNELSGWCVLDDGDQPLRLAYMAAIDGASNVAAILPLAQSTTITEQKDTNSSSIIDQQGSNTSPITDQKGTRSSSNIDQQGFNTSSDALFMIENSGPSLGLADSFVLSAEQQAKPDQPFTITAFGWRETEKFGVPLLEFAVALSEAWDNPSNYRYFLYLDTDQDTIDEMVLFGFDWSLLGFDPGMIVTGFDDALEYEDVGGDSSLTQWFVQDGDYNNQVIVLPYFSAVSGINALFKPHVTTLEYRLLVVDRNDNTDEVTGQINLNNPLASQQISISLDEGENLTVSKQPHPQLWIAPNNQEPHQHFVVE